MQVAELLLAHEADVEARDAQGNTPLHLAAQQQQTRLVQILLESGADPDPENSVFSLFSSSTSHCTSLFFQKGATPLHLACSLGSRGIIDYLLQHGALLNKQNKVAEVRV